MLLHGMAAAAKSSEFPGYSKFWKVGYSRAWTILAPTLTILRWRTVHRFPFCRNAH